ELLLEDLTALWNARPENRQLPSFLQCLQIRWWTRKKNWKGPERRMMRKATRYHALRGLLVAVLLSLVSWGGYEAYGTIQARSLRDTLLSASIADVRAVVSKMGPYRRWLNPLLRKANQDAKAKSDSAQQLNTSLALLHVDDGHADYLFGRLLEAPVHEV